MALAAHHQAWDVLDRQARGDGHAMPALLADHMHVFVTRGLERLRGKLAVTAFDFLQTQNVRRLLVQEAADLGNAQSHRIDIPGG